MTNTDAHVLRTGHVESRVGADEIVGDLHFQRVGVYFMWLMVTTANEESHQTPERRNAMRLHADGRYAQGQRTQRHVRTLLPLYRTAA